jgi:hypothetical protein
MLGYDNPEVRDRMIIATAGEAASDLAAIVAAGADELIVNLPMIRSTDAIHTAADVLRQATE